MTRLARLQKVCTNLVSVYNTAEVNQTLQKKANKTEVSTHSQEGFLEEENRNKNNLRLVRE